MATALEQKPAPPTPKHEAFVEQQLAKASGRIRSLDAGAYFLLFLILTLGYFLAVALVDRAWNLPTGVRLVTFGLYALGAIYFLVKVTICFVRPVNPYYAARQLEQTVPNAKNSVINWIDLKEEKLPGAIRGALGVRAAKDLKRTDAEKAISSRTTLVLGAVLLGLVLGLLVLFVMDSSRFGELFRRAFAPFQGISLGARTSIDIEEPEGGNVEVPKNRAVRFRATIRGWVPPVNHPDAPRVLYRFNPSEPYDPKVSLALSEGKTGWTATMPADLVQNDFRYKITAGDITADDPKNPEYTVTVQSFPLVTQYAVTYHFRDYYRPYKKAAEETIVYPPEGAPHPRLSAYRGTAITLLARTNRKLQTGHLEFDFAGVKSDLAGEILPGEGDALRFKFTLKDAFALKNSGHFRVVFTSKAGEGNSNPSYYPIEILTDGVPRVELTQPAKDVELPANGTLPLVGWAEDDFGIKSMTLRLKVLEGGDRPALAAKAYRLEKAFQLVDGTYPDKLDYKDFLALDQLKTDKGAAFPLAKGMVLEYWLEANDNSDFPSKTGNVGKSKRFKINILDPDQNKKNQENQRNQAKRDQRKHNQQQDKKIDQQNQAKQNPNQDPKHDQEDDLKKKADELEKAAQEHKKQQQKTGQGKGEPKKAESKPGNPNPNDQPGEAKDQKPPKPEQAGKPKDDGAKGKGDPKAGQAKDQGKPPENNPAQTKGAKDQPQNAAKGGEQKDPKKDPSQAAAPKNQPQDKQNPAAAKDQGTGDPKTSQAKNNSPDKKQNPAQAKESGKTQPASQAKNEHGKQADQQPAKAEAKGGQPKNAAAKENQDKKSPPQASAKGGEKKVEQPDTSASKAGEQPEQKSFAKDAKEDPAKALGKDSKTQPKETAKQADPKQADKTAQAKDRGPLDKALKEVAKHKDDLQGDDQQVRNEARDELKRLAKDEKVDPMVRDEAKNALEEEKGTSQAKDVSRGPDDKDPEVPAKPDFDTKKGQNPAQAKGGPPMASQGKGKDGKEQKVEPKFIAKGKDGGDKAGHYGPGARGIADRDLKAKDPNLDHGKYGADLNLKDLKNLPKEALPKGWTEEQYQRFLKEAEEYNRELAKLREQDSLIQKDGTGNFSQIKSAGPYKVGKSPPTTDTTPRIQTGAPPEFRDDYRTFTRPPDAAPKKKE